MSEQKLKKYNIDSNAPCMTVGVGKLGISSAEYIFETTGIIPCSGYTLLSRSMRTAGLYHAPPYPVVDQYADELEAFSGGFCRPIHSARSREKKDFEQFLAETLDIHLLPAIALLADNSIDILFAPALNKIAILGSSSKNAKHYNFK